MVVFPFPAGLMAGYRCRLTDEFQRLGVYWDVLQAVYLDVCWAEYWGARLMVAMRAG